MDLSDERLRHHLLTNGPRGRWRTLPGSHGRLLDESIEFRDDGSGSLETRSVMRPGERLAFRWRVAGYGIVECQPVYDTPERDAHGEPEAADWFRIVFAIEPHPTDAGTPWVLKERGTTGFWELTAPVVPAD